MGGHSGDGSPWRGGISRPPRGGGQEQARRRSVGTGDRHPRRYFRRTDVRSMAGCQTAQAGACCGDPSTDFPPDSRDRSDRGASSCRALRAGSRSRVSKLRSCRSRLPHRVARHRHTCRGSRGHHGGGCPHRGHSGHGQWTRPSRGSLRLVSWRLRGRSRRRPCVRAARPWNPLGV